MCQATGVPVPCIQWYFNTVMINLSNSSKYISSSMSLNETIMESTLFIINVESSDVGTYTCEAENIIGTDRSSAVLTVNSECLLKYPYIVYSEKKYTNGINCTYYTVPFSVFSIAILPFAFIPHPRCSSYQFLLSRLPNL